MSMADQPWLADGNEAAHRLEEAKRLDGKAFYAERKNVEALAIAAEALARRLRDLVTT